MWRVPEGPVWRAPEGPVWRVPEGPVWRARAGFEAQPGRGAGGRWWSPAAVSTNNSSTQPKQISHAIPPRHGSMHAQKPQNINDQTSTLEIHSGELHAKLVGEWPVGQQAASRRRACPVSARSAAAQRPVSGRSALGQRPLSGRSAAAQRSVSARSAPGQRLASGPWGLKQRHAGGLARSAAGQRPLSGWRAALLCHGLGYSPGAPRRPNRTRRGWTRGPSTGRRAPWPRSCREP